MLAPTEDKSNSNMSTAIYNRCINDSTPGTAEQKARHFDITMAMLDHHKADVIPGNIIIGIWKDIEELKKWQSFTDKENSKVVIINSESLPLFNMADKSLILLGLGTGVQADYSDLNLLYFVAVKRDTSSA
jgi:hypothetical protein